MWAAHHPSPPPISLTYVGGIVGWCSKKLVMQKNSLLHGFPQSLKASSPSYTSLCLLPPSHQTSVLKGWSLWEKGFWQLSWPHSDLKKSLKNCMTFTPKACFLWTGCPHSGDQLQAWVKFAGNTSNVSDTGTVCNIRLADQIPIRLWALQPPWKKTEKLSMQSEESCTGATLAV